MREIEDYTAARDRAKTLQAIAAVYAGAAQKDVQLHINAIVLINGVPIAAEQTAILERALAGAAQADIVQLFTVAIQRANLEAAGLKAAAKAKYDALFT
jgi:hypothetical protein